MQQKLRELWSRIKNYKYHFRWWHIPIVFFLILIIGGVAGVSTLSHNPEQAALFADNVLRPLIGEEATIATERLLFSVEDQVNKVRYKEPVADDYQLGVKTTTLPTAAPLAATPPPNITPYINTEKPLAGEGRWGSIVDTPLATTFIRTDSERAYSVVNLVYIPLSEVGVDSVAGTKFPGGQPGPGVIPQKIQASNKLIAAFNGGFQEKDGHYGMYANGVTYVPLKNSMPTIFGYTDGRVEIKPYDGKGLTADVLFARQNGPYLVENGKDADSTSRGIDLWAGTATGGYVTWRSGLGITPKGDLVYAVGPSLTPTAIADGLRLAGAVRAVQLDVNDFWVRFMIYKAQGGGNYTSSTLVKGLADGGKAYLNGYEKDFFYLYAK